MANKERLIANNEKIAEIRQILKNKLLGTGVKLTWTLLEDGSYKLEIGA